MYDARNELASARVDSGTRTLFGYDALGRRSFVSRPNGVRTDYAYDGASELLSMVHSTSGSVLLGFSYTYDGQGNRVTKTREDGTAEVYGYDESMRLTQVDYGTAQTVAYTLDTLGNRSVETQTAHGATNVTTIYSATFNNFNQLKTRNRTGGGLPAANVTYAYDRNGNTLSETTASPAAVTSYTWDRDSRLRIVTPPSPALPTSYAYDANGLRTQRSDTTGIVNYLLGGPSVLEELDGVLATQTRYLNNPQAIDDIISYQRVGTTEYPLTDALGSIYASTDVSGSVVRRYSFDVYGVRTDLGGSPPAVDVGYTGRWHDADGLVEHRNRLRRPNWAIGCDPIDLECSMVQVSTRTRDPVPTFAIDYTGDRAILVVFYDLGRTVYHYPSMGATRGTTHQLTEQNAGSYLDAVKSAVSQVRGIGIPPSTDIDARIVNSAEEFADLAYQLSADDNYYDEFYYSGHSSQDGYLSLGYGSTVDRITSTDIIHS